MRKCFQVIIYMSWFWLDKSKNFSNILSCNIYLQDWPNIKNSFEKSAYQSWFSKYWFYNAWRSWICRIYWIITYPILEISSQEFYSDFSGCLNGVSVPFMANLTNLTNLTNLSVREFYQFFVPNPHEADSFPRASFDNDLLSAKSWQTIH